PSSVADSSIRKELEYIKRLEINVAYPFLLQVFEDVENGLIEKEEVLKILRLIQSYAWRRFIVGLPTNALNKIFMTLYAEVDTDDCYNSIALALIKKKGSAKFPTNEDLKSSLKEKDLYNTQPKNRNYFFEMLENYNNREYVDTANEHITIEHIFPKNPNEDWKNDLKGNDYFLFKEKHLNTIGNLTLSGNNGALSNKSFLAKKKMNIEGNEQGYEFSRLWLNSYLKSIDSWDVLKYEERTKIVYERFLKIWEYPDIEIIETGESEEQNVFDAENPTFKKIEYFIFENTKIEEETIAQMYFYVLRNLFQKNLQLLRSSEHILKMTRNTSDFRASQELENGWFIESNIDSNSKFGVLKRLLSVFEMEDDLFIKYMPNSDGKVEPSGYNIRKKYWQQLLPLIVNTSLYSNISPSKDHWLSAGAGISGISYALSIAKTFVRIELGITSSSKERNKMYFKKLLKNKELIEKAFGKELVWQELPENKMSRIKIEEHGIGLLHESDWEKMNAFFIDNLHDFENALQPFIKNLK
ncbi:MAG: DUF4268 domain-containing protein, partial [Thiomicrorhabdus sp.]|nr:DUF4268 domain-containing protein [Thiomicrorhabdus sp.]